MRYTFGRQPLPAHDRTAIEVNGQGTSYTMFYRGAECVAVVMTSMLTDWRFSATNPSMSEVAPR